MIRKWYLCLVEWHDADGGYHERALTYNTFTAHAAAREAAGSTHFVEDETRLSRIRVYELVTYQPEVFNTRRAPEWVLA